MNPEVLFRNTETSKVDWGNAVADARLSNSDHTGFGCQKCKKRPDSAGIRADVLTGGSIPTTTAVAYGMRD